MKEIADKGYDQLSIGETKEASEVCMPPNILSILKGLYIWVVNICPAQADNSHEYQTSLRQVKNSLYPRGLQIHKLQHADNLVV